MLDGDDDVRWPQGVFLARGGVVTNGQGDVFVLAQPDNHVSFGSAAVGPGLVVARLDADGHEIWSRALATGLTNVAGIVAQKNLTAVIAGSYRGTLDLGGGPMSSAQGSTDVFVVQLDTNGSVLWQRSFGDQLEQTAYSMAVAPNDDVLLIGSNNGVIDLGGGPVLSNGGIDAFAARLTGSDGQHVWSRGFGQSGQQEGRLIAAGKDGRVALSCYLGSGGIDFGGGVITSFGGGDIVMAVFDESGGYLWARHPGGAQSDNAQDLAFDGPGNVYMCGSFSGTMTTGGDVLQAEPTALQNGFALAYGPGGEPLWSFALVDSSNSIGSQVGITDTGDCVLLATKRHSFQGAGVSLPAATFLLLGFDALGNLTGADAYGQANASARVNMGTLGNRLYIAGVTNRKVDLGGGELAPTSGFGMFIGRLDAPRAPKVTISGFNARTDGADVELRWTIESGEALSNYYLTRSLDGSSQAQLIHSAPAEDGTFSFLDNVTHPGHVHTYKLTVETALGDAVSDDASIIIPVFATSLAQNVPNPFNPMTTFTYSLAAPVHVSIAIYDLTGTVVAKLDQGMQPAGKHRAQWAGHNWEGNLVGSGVYFYRLEGAGDVGARKMVLLK